MGFQKNGLYFREVEPADLPKLRELRNLSASGWRDNRGVQTILQQEQWYLRLGNDNMAFIAMDGGTAIGCLRISQVDWLHRAANVSGTDVYPEFQGKGYGSRMLRAGVEYVIKDLGMHRATAQATAGNKAAQCIIEKAGLKREGVARKAIWRENEWVDWIQYGILAEELNGLPAKEGK